MGVIFPPKDSIKLAEIPVSRSWLVAYNIQFSGDAKSRENSCQMSITLKLCVLVQQDLKKKPGLFSTNSFPIFDMHS